MNSGPKQTGFQVKGNESSDVPHKDEPEEYPDNGKKKPFHNSSTIKLEMRKENKKTDGLSDISFENLNRRNSAFTKAIDSDCSPSKFVHGHKKLWTNAGVNRTHTTNSFKKNSTTMHQTGLGMTSYFSQFSGLSSPINTKKLSKQGVPSRPKVRSCLDNPSRIKPRDQDIELQRAIWNSFQPGGEIPLSITDPEYIGVINLDQVESKEITSQDSSIPASAPLGMIPQLFIKKPSNPSKLQEPLKKFTSLDVQLHPSEKAFCSKTYHSSIKGSLKIDDPNTNPNLNTNFKTKKPSLFNPSGTLSIEAKTPKSLTNAPSIRASLNPKEAKIAEMDESVPSNSVFNEQGSSLQVSKKQVSGTSYLSLTGKLASPPVLPDPKLRFHK